MTAFFIQVASLVLCIGTVLVSSKSNLFANTKRDAASIGFDDAFIYEQINVLYLNRDHFIDNAKEAITVFQSWTEEDKIKY